MNLRGKVTVKYRDLSYAWVDATNGILQIDITRGIPNYQGMWSQSQPGQLRLRSRNTNLDPAKNDQVKTFTMIRVEVEGTPIFTGKIFDTNTEYFPREDSIITIDAFDELGVLSQRKIINRKVINHDYEAKQIVSPINFGSFIQWGSYTTPSLASYTPHIIEGYERVIKEYNSRYNYQPAYPQGAGNYHLWYSTDQTKYPTPGGVSSYNYKVPSHGINRTDSVWQLPDWDGLVVTNPHYQSRHPRPGFYSSNIYSGWGTTMRGGDGSTHCTPTSIGRDGINYNSASGSKPSVDDPYHPLYDQAGYWNSNWGKTNTTGKDSWAALYTTDDNNAYELWLKCEQSEAGFGYVDAYNRFRHFSRAIIDNDNLAQPVKLSFQSNGSGTSYNSIKVTSGAESIIKGVNVNNLWNSQVVTNKKLDAFRDQEPDDITYQKSTNRNRDNTTTNKTLQPSSTVSPIKKYDWLNYSTIEPRDSYDYFARTNDNLPIWETYQRDWDISTLSTRPYFKGELGVNGTNQLTLNTNYAWNLGHEYGGFVRTADSVTWNQDLINYPNGRADNVLDRQKELANMVLENYSNPSTDIRSINFSVHNDDIDSIKGVDIFDAISINHNESGLSIDKNYAVMGISHTITPDSWDVSYQLWNREGRP
jgi:hypothetical protein